MNMSVYTTNITKRIHTATFAQIVCMAPQDQTIVSFVCRPPNHLVVMELCDKLEHSPLLSTKMIPTLVEMSERLHVGHLFISSLSCVYSFQSICYLVVSTESKQGVKVTSLPVGVIRPAKISVITSAMQFFLALANHAARKNSLPP